MAKKASGILLHITSLPCSFGTGDLGPCAYQFIDQLNQSAQSYWQILPVNYPDYSASPYSCLSAFAGNPYLISPELLKNKHFITQEQLDSAKEAFIQNDRLDYELVKEVKTELLKSAYESFGKTADSSLEKTQFQSFLQEEKYWIHNFALYKSLVNQLGEKWWTWPAEFRDYETLKNKSTVELSELLSVDLERDIKFQQWVQFEFHQQWHLLRKYAQSMNIKIIGDIPIFVSHRSQDVWSWKEGFQINADGTLKQEAGVPPDQFSESGQKWSMPTYQWSPHLETNFKWWRERIKKQFEFYDLIRLDHFIGYHHLFNIDPTEPTAKNGIWIKTPGEELLSILENDYLKEHIKTNEAVKSISPFIAEDLGEVTEEVHQLRQRHNIPCMRVLQFGFWSDHANEHHPHSIEENSVYYSGTHDTSTIKGWYQQCTENELQRVEICLKKNRSEITQFDFIHQLMQSQAKITILPIQDLFFLDDQHRFNIPGTENNNWRWRITTEDLFRNQTPWQLLKTKTEETGRAMNDVAKL